MNRAARRATKPVRIPHFKIAHLERLEKGYDSHAFTAVANRDVPASIVQEQTTRARAAWALLSTGQPASHEAQASACNLLVQLYNITRHRAEQIAAANPSAQLECDLMRVSLLRAESDLLAMQQRGEAGGNYTPTPLALQSIPDLLDLHEQILSLSTTLQMQKALEAVLAAQRNSKQKPTPARAESAQSATN